MRVISGLAGGYGLKPPDGLQIRPTADRAKEALFNMLSFELADIYFLDLFCGTGAVGIEALSRGAARAVFVDISPEACRLTEQNLKHTGFLEKSTIIRSDYMSALKQFGSEARNFDIIFLDPPYEGNMVENAVSAIRDYGLIKDGGYIVAETSAGGQTPDIAGTFPVYRDKKYGLARIIIMKAGESIDSGLSGKL